MSQSLTIRPMRQNLTTRPFSRTLAEAPPHKGGFFVDHLLLSSRSCSCARMRHASSMRFNAHLTSSVSGAVSKEGTVPSVITENISQTHTG